MNEIAELDRQNLMAICGGEVPDSTIEFYKVCKMGWMRRASGAMPVHMLTLIAAMTSGIKEPEVPRDNMDGVPVGVFVAVLNAFNRREEYQGVYVGIGTGVYRGMATIAYFGNKNHLVYAASKDVVVLKEVPNWAMDEVAVEPEQLEIPKGESSEQIENAKDQMVKSHPWNGHQFGTCIQLAEPGRAMVDAYFVGVDRDTLGNIVRVPSLPAGDRDVVVDPESCLPVHDNGSFRICPEACKFLGGENHSFSDIPEGTRARLCIPNRDDTFGWIRGVGPDGSILVRMSTGVKAQRDRSIPECFVVPEMDDNGVPVVDLRGMADAGPVGKS
ncbi:hypothetical protein KC887_00280 [Candidatus Kaiserbacteria bacterium]|nr:hypothetical protein [Candidatus Kaiserbacteria bacterium]